MSEEQARHDAAHPGKVCRQCPDQVAFTARLEALRDHLRLPWYRRILRREPGFPMTKDA